MVVLWGGGGIGEGIREIWKGECGIEDDRDESKDL